MKYNRKWVEYTVESRKLAESNPTKTRFCIRYRHSKGLLVLKVTDDRTCLKFTTRSSAYLNRFEALTRELMIAQMNFKVAATRPVNVTPALDMNPPISSADLASATGAAGSAEGSSADKKKKKKGKKK